MVGAGCLLDARAHNLPCTRSTLPGYMYSVLSRHVIASTARNMYTYIHVHQRCNQYCTALDSARTILKSKLIGVSTVSSASASFREHSHQCRMPLLRKTEYKSSILQRRNKYFS